MYADLPEGRLDSNSRRRFAGLSRRTSRPHFRQNTWPILANNSRRRRWSRWPCRRWIGSIRLVFLLVTAIAGGMPSIGSGLHRFFQPLEELPGVGGKALDVAALPFGIERIECQAALAAAAEAAEHDQLAMGNVQVDGPQVMNSHAPQRDVAGNAPRSL